MAAGDPKAAEEDRPTLAFSTVCGRLGITEEDEVMDAYGQIKTVLGVYTKYIRGPTPCPG